MKAAYDPSLQMTDRQRFNATMHYQVRDRCPIMDFGFWPQTLEAWRQQGLPADAELDVFFGMDAQWHTAPIDVGLRPAFESAVLEDRGDVELVRQADGVICLRPKHAASVPLYVDWTLKDRASWQEHYKWRLDPSLPDRVPVNWPELASRYRQRDYPLAVPAGSLYGWLRNWMGLENISLLIYDDPELLAEMVATVADCILGVLERVFAEPVDFDYAHMWEDMCYNGGPLMSPQAFRRFLLPHYKRISAFLRQRGVELILLDCDGKIDELIPLWLEGGVNILFPMEVGTWGADPLAYRKQYGKQLRMMGGVSKLTLAAGKEPIARAVRHLAPLVDEGGYIPFCDHRVPPTVPFENYWFYLQQAREVFGRGVHLKPMGQPAW